MTRCRISELCERFKLDIGIYDPKSKRIFPGNVKQRNKCVDIHKNHYCVIWKKNRKHSLLNGVEDKKFKHGKNKKKRKQFETKISL